MKMKFSVKGLPSDFAPVKWSRRNVESKNDNPFSWFTNLYVRGQFVNPGTTIEQQGIGTWNDNEWFILSWRRVMQRNHTFYS